MDLETVEQSVASIMSELERRDLLGMREATNESGYGELRQLAAPASPHDCRAN